MSLTGITFLIAFGLGCTLAFVRHPIYGLMTYVGVFYLDPYSRWWSETMPDLRWSYTAAIATILALMVRKQKPRAIHLFSHKVVVGYMFFVAWCAIQTPWVLDFDMHMELLNLTAKYALVMCLIYLCVDSEQHLRAFLWTHVLGCFFLGWLAYTHYEGGRFEGFGGGTFGEANAGAIQIVTGILVAASMFLVGRTIERAILIGCIPFILNGLVTTISRSGFLALTTGGVIFNLLVHSRHRARVRLLSILALVLFLMLTGPSYWNRIDTITYAGEEVQGVDTGSGRLDIIKGQWRMFLDYPLGCGHRCTITLSPEYLSTERLTQGGRSSHNTFMTLLVEQGIPGAAFYFGMIAWTLGSISRLRRDLRNVDGPLPAYFSATAAILGAVVVGDLFVDYLKLEARMWFIAIMMVVLNMARERKQAANVAPAPAHSNQLLHSPET